MRLDQLHIGEGFSRRTTDSQSRPEPSRYPAMHSPIFSPSPTTRRCAGLFIVLALSAGGGHAVAGTSPEQSHQTTAKPQQEIEQTVAHHWGWANPHIAAMVEGSARALVDVLGRADQALAGQSPVLAAHNLDYADKLAHAIELQMPYVAIKDRLEDAKGKLEAGATHDFFDDLAPVYANIDDLLLVAPGLGGQIKGKVQKAEQQAKAGKKDEALKQVDAVLDQVTATRVYIPILYVQGQIDAARKALTKQKIEAARADVAKALDSLTLVITGDTAEGTVDVTSPKPRH